MYSLFTQEDNEKRLKLAKRLGWTPTQKQEEFFLRRDSLKNEAFDRREGKSTMIVYDALTCAILFPHKQLISSANWAGSKIIQEKIDTLVEQNNDMLITVKRSNNKIELCGSIVFANRDTKGMHAATDRIFCDDAEIEVTTTWMQSALMSVAHSYGQVTMLQSRKPL